MSVQPGRREVDNALKQVRRSVKSARKATNQAAAKLLARGKYVAAEALVARARGLEGFEEEVVALNRRWREVLGKGAGSAGQKKQATALWEYYQPVLRAIVALGNDTTRAAIEQHLEPLAGKLWKPGDLEVGSGGRPRWMVMVRRCRRPMVKQGWLESQPIKSWRVTAAGKRAAASGSTLRAEVA